MADGDLILRCFKALATSVQQSALFLRDADVSRYRATFENVGFVQIPNIINEQSLIELCVYVTRGFSTHFYHLERRLRPDLKNQMTGYSIKRAFFDPTNSEDRVAPKWKECQSFLRTGAQYLAEAVTPTVRKIVGQYSYESGNMFLYCEGDYAGLHNDNDNGNRVNVQFPLSLNSVGGIRILINEQLKMFYDQPGCLNLLGPRVWHEVPPLLRLPASPAPERTNLTLRYVQ